MQGFVASAVSGKTAGKFDVAKANEMSLMACADRFKRQRTELRTLGPAQVLVMCIEGTPESQLCAV
jgi:hypothetical protein